MSREGHIAIPIDTLAKQIAEAAQIAAAAAPRSWVSLDGTGKATVLDVNDNFIRQRVQIHPRDLHIIGPKYPSTILGRERVILVNLEYIKAIITAQEVLLLDPLDDNVIPVVDELKRRLPLEEDESPFEFRALEVALEVICKFLNARTTEFITDAQPTIVQLKSKNSERSWVCVHKLKSEMTRLIKRVQKVRDELKKLLDDDDDMAELYLSRKIVSSSSISGSGAPNGLLAPDFSTSTANRATTETFRGDANDVNELEMLLETYFVQVENTLNGLDTLREDIDHAEDYIKMQLGSRTNQFLRMEYILTCGTFCFSLYNLVTGTFGMNIPFKWTDPQYGFMFKWVVILSIVVCVALFVLIISCVRRPRVDLMDQS